MMSEKSVMVLDQCLICDLPNVVAINRDLVYRRGIREVFTRNKIPEQYPDEDIDKLRHNLLIHLRDHITKPTQALTNHMLNKQAVELKNTVIETNTTIDQIDQFSIDVQEMMDTLKVENPDLWIKAGKVYSDLLKRRQDSVTTLHKISGKEKGDEVKGAMMSSYFTEIGKILGNKRVAQIKQNQQKSKTGKESRVDFVLDDHLDVEELMDDIENMKEAVDDKLV